MIENGFIRKYGAFFLVLGLTLASLVFVFWWALVDLSHAWEKKEYSYSYYLPFLAVLMALHRLSARPLPPLPSWSGVGVVSLGLALFSVGELAAFRQLAHYGFFVSLVGVCLAYCGGRITRLVAPAFVLLLFAIPLPVQFEHNLSLELKLLSSKLGTWFLGAFGVPVFQDGNVIDLGTYKLQVVDACSGLRYLFPLMSFGYLVAYLLKDTFWKRALVFLSAIPITVFLNALRITLVGLTVNQWGPQMAEGVLHEFEGWVVFSLCLLVLAGVVAVVLKVGKGGSFDLDFFSWPRAPFLTAPLRVSRIGLTLLGITLLASLWVGSGGFKDRTPSIPTQRDFTLFPLTIGDWQGKSQSMEENILRELDLTSYWLADYVAPGQPQGGQVNLYIAYYATQKMGSTIHSPATCLPGGGWEIESLDEIPLTLSGEAASIKNVARMIVRKGMMRQVIYYWFNQQGKNISNRLLVKKALLLDALLYNKTEGALIRLVTPVAENETIESAEKRLQSFMVDALPPIQQHLPRE